MFNLTREESLSKDNSAVNNIYLQATESGLNLLRFELEIKD